MKYPDWDPGVHTAPLQAKIRYLHPVFRQDTTSQKNQIQAFIKKTGQDPIWNQKKFLDPKKMPGSGTEKIPRSGPKIYPDPKKISGSGFQRKKTDPDSNEIPGFGFE